MDFYVLKNPSTSVGLNPRTLDLEASTLPCSLKREHYVYLFVFPLPVGLSLALNHLQQDLFPSANALAEGTVLNTESLFC